MRVLRDRQFGAALAAAPLFWLVFAFLRPLSPDLGWPLRAPLLFLLPAFVYPVLEEACFRGLLQPALHRQPWGCARFAGLSVANWVTAALFSMSHLVWHVSWQALAVFLPGLVFGHFRDRYNRIGPSVLLHASYNSGFVWLFAGATR